MPPKLHYLTVKISGFGKQFTTQALVDTGCAKTAMSTKFFETINQHNNFSIAPNQNVKIQTCDGTNHPVSGTTNVTILIGKGEFPVEMNVLVIPNLADNFLLGLDLLASSHVEKITPESIFMKKRDDSLMVENFDTITFPISELKLPDAELEPMETRHLHWYDPSLTKADALRCKSLMPNLILNENPKLIDGMIKVTVTNISKVKLTLPKHHEKIMKIQKCSFPNYIPNDEFMSLEEHNDSFEQLNKSGYYQPSLTSYIENRNVITEFDLFEKPEYVTDDDLLKQFELSHLDKRDINYFKKVVLKNRSAFSTHKWDIGVTHEIEMDIIVKTPELRIQKYIPIPLHTRDKVKDILDQFLNIGIIRHCIEPSKYCSNILVVPKKDKDSIRLLFDGRLLNYDTERLPMASISKSEILSQLAGKRHLSSLDFADAFYHIPLSKEAQPLTAFYAHTHALRMCFTRAPQGLKNSPLYLKILLDKIFLDMTNDVLFYADDLLIATDGSLREHLEVVEKVIIRIAKAGLKLRPAKLLLARKSLEFLGMIFERNTLNIPPLKLEAFKKLPSPNTPKRLKSAICAFSYYRHFVPKFSAMSNTLMELASQHPKVFKFTTEHETMFRALIDHICENAQTYFPDPNLPFYLQTDASMYCAGGICYQKDPKTDEMRLITAVSRTFTKTERNYTIYKKEALSLMYSLRANDFFLRHAPKLIILVDSRALIYIRLAKESSGILLRFSLELSKYEAELLHISGVNNVIPDLLSRQHTDISKIQQEIRDNKTISEKDSISIIDALTIPDNLPLSKSQMFALLNGPSPIDDASNDKTRKSKIIEGKKAIKNTPQTLNRRTIKMPRTTRSRGRPGVILPTNVVTRAQAKKAVQFADEAGRPLCVVEGEHTHEVTKTRGPRRKKRIKPHPLQGRNRANDGSDTENNDQDTVGDPNIETDDKEIGSGVDETLTTNLNPTGEGTSSTSTEDTVLLDTGENNETLNQNENLLDMGAGGRTRTSMPQASQADENTTTQELEYSSDQYDYGTLGLGCQLTGSRHMDGVDLAFLQLKCERIMNQVESDEQVEMRNGIYVKKVNDVYKPLLPKSLLKFLINSHHYTDPGIHKSRTRIKRDLLHVYCIEGIDLNQAIEDLIKDCHICQIYSTEKPLSNYTNLPRFKSPRLSWSVDLITDLPVSINKFKLLLIGVDDFSNYIVTHPLMDASTVSLINAIKQSIISPFGCPQYIRSDEQPGIYNSKEFFKFLSYHKIDLLATAVASPFSNGRAESHIKIFKHSARKFFYHHKSIDQWDENLHFISNALNQSVNTFGFSPEEIMFGYRMERQFQPPVNLEETTDEIQAADKIVDKANIMREKYEAIKLRKEQSNLTFKNIHGKIEIVPGELVLHRQMQVSTGTSSKWKPTFTGPYIVNEVKKSKRTALCQHAVTGRLIKAHFNNIVPYRYAPDTFRVPANPEN